MRPIPSVPPADPQLYRFLDALRSAALEVAAVVTTDALVETSNSLDLKLTDNMALVDATTTTVIIRLPSASNQVGKVFHIKKIDSSGNAVTVDGYGDELIDGATTVTLSAQWDSCLIKSNGRNWFRF